MVRLRENLVTTLHQIDQVFIVDNASTNVESVKTLAAEFPGVSVYPNRTNLGIASALNTIFERAADSRATWALLLDQDSVCSSTMVDELIGNAVTGVGIVAPGIIDRSDAHDHSALDQPMDLNYCITSGSLCRISTWQLVGGYDESMFIDFVDFDYCLRVRAQGLRIVRAPKAFLLHEIGKITRHGGLIAYHHSAFRSYHMARDMLYYARKHRRSQQELKVQNRGLLATYLILIRKTLIVAAFEEDRLRRVTALIRGMISGTFRRRGLP